MTAVVGWLAVLRTHPLRQVLAALAVWLLAGCAPDDPFGGNTPKFFAADAYPTELSQWNLLLQRGEALALNPAAQTYDVNMPLFSDYAAKHRALWLPPDTQLAPQPDGKLTFPVGSIISKTFLYPQGHAGATELTRLTEPVIATRGAQVVETRLMVRQANGWEAMSYVWQGNDAYLKRTGAVVPVKTSASGSDTFSYVVPSANECASCHATDHRSGQLQPIGLQLAQLQSAESPGATSNHSAEQLTARGWLLNTPAVAAPYPSWEDRRDPTSHARAYLDSNCAHCHSKTGPAKTSGLDLTRNNNEPHAMGICKAPIAAGKGSGGRLYSIVPGAPDESIISYRLQSTDPSRRMPEIGRSLTHAAGLLVVNQWIASIAGECR
ncbi:MAG: hypothetical protein AB8B93_11685 [Pseudomonadales bacterium]